MKFIMKHASLFALLTIMALGTLIQANEDVTFINGRGLKKGSKKSGKSEKSAKSGKSPKSGKKRSKKDVTSAPSSSPSAGPTISPSSSPIEDVMTARKKKSPKSSSKTTESPSQTPSESPSDAPSESPSDVPSGSPSDSPSDSPSPECPLPPDAPSDLILYTYPGFPNPPPQEGFVNIGVDPISQLPVDTINYAPLTIGKNVGLSFRGYLYFQEEGLYTICLTSDDGSYMYLDGVTFIDNTPGSSITCQSHYVPKCGETREVIVDYTQSSGTAYVVLTWTPPTAAGGVVNVPPGAFFRSS